MEQNKDQSGAAVRALPSGLTEREQIDLLCQVENYMSITEKHSQTAPEAVAEETRMYGLVNGFIAKRFSDIGAAVRGEAVAGLDGWKIGNAGNGSIVIQKEGLGGCIAERDSESIAESILYELACSVRYAPVSARAADAPSEPSEKSRKFIDNVGYREEVWRDAQFRDLKSRAADALDSQPTERASNDAVKIAVSALKEISEWRFGWDGDCGVTAVADAALEAIEAAHASSQPADGGVRNG